MKFTRRNGAGVLSGLLALLCADSTVVAEHDRVRSSPRLQLDAGRVRLAPPSESVLIERVNFVLDQEAQTKEEEAKKKRKAEQQHRAATAKPKPGPKAASEAAASSVRPTASEPQPSASSAAATRTQHGAQSAASEPSPPQGSASATPAAKSAPASSAASSPTVASAPAPTSTNAATAAALNQAESGNTSRPGGSQPSRLTRDQLIPLMRGATILRTNTSGALRQWVNGPDGTLTVYWAAGGFLQPHSASGKWSVTEDGHFCLQIDWPDVPENWCRFMERTASGAYQPVPDSADATWTPPKDKTEWRPMTIRR
ncbi:hypothetical protein VSR68_32260 [Paraburkholderia phymatum]|uniref:hypothetical protein n=1 Tax=Paraburkholderia phymatum TaxID=148447 RepID=UPI003170FA35